MSNIYVKGAATLGDLYKKRKGAAPFEAKLFDFLLLFLYFLLFCKQKSRKCRRSKTSAFKGPFGGGGLGVMDKLKDFLDVKM